MLLSRRKKRLKLYAFLQNLRILSLAPAQTISEVMKMDIYNADKDDCLDNPVASSMECTGLIPALPETEAELEFYEEMYPFLTPAASKDPEDVK